MRFQTYAILKNNNYIFELGSAFFLAGMKAQRDEGGERILLGYNKGVRPAMLRPIRFYCVRVWISVGLFFIRVFLTICTWYKNIPSYAGPSRM